MQLVAVLVTGALLLGVLELVRRRRLLERYAVLWLFSALALLGLAAWRPLLGGAAEMLGIYYAPSALFVIAVGFVLLLLLHFSVAVSRLAEQSKVLGQRIALAEEHQRRLQRERTIRAAAGFSSQMAESATSDAVDNVLPHEERPMVASSRRWGSAGSTDDA